ncbi:uncharacterized protein [Nicotiana tomentosiformis]|uniref:uncharacterized protein n=1 Tax=Nicotiana tomentosiformis TaxID=4098 RepID=UPI00388C9C36
MLSDTIAEKQVIVNSEGLNTGYYRCEAFIIEIQDKGGPYQKIDECEVVDFLWKNIICKFGIPKDIACDNRPLFIGAKVTKFLKDLKIKRITSSPYHPSANGQAESTNKVIIQNLKKRLEAAKGK